MKTLILYKSKYGSTARYAAMLGQELGSAPADIDAAGAKQAAPEFTDRVTLRWQMPEGTEPPLLEQLRELTRGGAQVSVSQPFYAPF